MTEGALGKNYANGELVVRQGEEGNCMYVVQAGTLEVLREEHDGSVRIAVMNAGDIFGEMSIFEREVRSASVRALGEARVLSIDKKTFLRRIQEDPPLAFNLVKIMAHRIRMLSEEVASLKQKTAPPAARVNAQERRTGRDRRHGRDRRAGVDRRAAPGKARSA
jgi:CRP/FNR family cyclic AMP-dependent transcriptional regulator